MSGSQDPLANQEGLHPHAVGVADDLLQLVEVGHLQGVLVGGDGTGQHHFGTYQLPVNKSEKNINQIVKNTFKDLFKKILEYIN